LIPGKRPEYRAMVERRRDTLQEVFREILPAGSPFVWEVGSGHGHFLAAYAAAHPEALCIGIDIASDRVARAQRKQVRAGLKNLHFLLADSEDFLAAVPSRARMESIFILFPDPWPKRRHHKNRVMKSAFLDRVAELTAKEARLYFRTDHGPYFEEAAAVVGAHPKWAREDSGELPFEEATVFEKRASAHFTLVARRR
jgi:tRNA (guanine-N7-)-methyltransferase